MKKHYFLILFLVFPLTLFTSCHRDWNILPPNNTAQQFFNLPAGSFPLVQQIAQSLQQEEKQYPFAVAVMAKAGYAVWNRALVLNGSEGARGSSDTTMIFIPLLRADSSGVGGILSCAILGSDTLYKIIYAGDYAQYGFAVNNGTPDAGAVALLLMQLEYQALGRNLFTLSDERLLANGTAAKSRWLQLQPQADGCVNCALAGSPAHAPCFNYDMWNDPGGVSATGAYAYSAEGCYNFTPTPGGSGNWNSGWATNVPQTGSGPGWSNSSPGWTAVQQSGYQHLLTSEISIADQQAINEWKLLKVDKSGLDSCRKIIIDKLLSGNNDLARLLVKLDKALNLENSIKDFKIKYVSNSNVPPNLAAITSCSFSDNVFEAVININPLAIQRSTDIAIAQTFIHETLHAYMDFILYRIMNGITIQQLNQFDYSQIFDGYIDSLINKNQNQLIQFHDCSPGNPNPICQYQHNYMANTLLNWMANALLQFDNNRIGNQEYYWLISWKGLQRTSAWLGSGLIILFILMLGGT
jgi:hypothetical protein